MAGIQKNITATGTSCTFLEPGVAPRLQPYLLLLPFPHSLAFPKKSENGCEGEIMTAWYLYYSMYVKYLSSVTRIEVLGGNCSTFPCSKGFVLCKMVQHILHGHCGAVEGNHVP